ncbi:MAG: hypothetical protein HFJ35_03000 [Clostridia bacterium]|nr:hypothetical protein [Clostridia bacterium]
MERMQQEDFDKIKPTIKSGERCSHSVVKLYYKGTHSDYGCVRCKMQSWNKEDFETDGNK